MAWPLDRWTAKSRHGKEEEEHNTLHGMTHGTSRLATSPRGNVSAGTRPSNNQQGASCFVNELPSAACARTHYRPVQVQAIEHVACGYNHARKGRELGRQAVQVHQLFRHDFHGPVVLVVLQNDECIIYARVCEQIAS